MTKKLEDTRIIVHLSWPILLVLVLLVNNAIPARAISLSQELPHRKVIVVDPGHGGHDLGAVGASGLAEKTLTLTVAHKVKEILLGAYEVHLTRNDDYSIDIEDRAAVANYYRADIFVSIHTGGGFRHRARGMVIFHSPKTVSKSESSRQQRNSMDMAEKPLPWDHIQGAHTAQNQALAKLLHSYMLAKLSFEDRGICEAPCFILRGADMPATIVEIGHLSHPADEKELSKPEVISAAAEAICEAIKEYFNKYP